MCRRHRRGGPDWNGGCQQAWLPLAHPRDGLAIWRRDRSARCNRLRALRNGVQGRGRGGSSRRQSRPTCRVERVERTECGRCPRGGCGCARVWCAAACACLQCAGGLGLSTDSAAARAGCSSPGESLRDDEGLGGGAGRLGRGEFLHIRCCTADWLLLRTAASG